jgi:hypothetical protein
MGRVARVAPVNTSGARKVASRFLLVLTAAGMLSGCIAKVQIPAVDQFHIVAGPQEGIVDTGLHEEILIKQLYELMKANEGIEVPICTAAKDSRQCLKEGIRVFVLGGVIPGIGKRTAYVFNEISLDGRQLEFSKDNSRTTFLGTPMLTRSNKCRVHAAAGGLQVEMTKYYANWAGIGNMFMAEGWAIDFMDLNQGIVGLQLELDIKGYFTTGSGSRYVLLKFPNIPESLSRSATQFIFLDRKQGYHAGAP